MFSELLFLAELLIAEFLLTFRLRRNSYYILRVLGVVAVLFLVAFFLPFVDNVWYNCAMYLVIFALSVIGLKIVCKEPWINVIFCGIAAYTVQHLAYQFTNLIFTFILWGESPLFGMYHVGVVDVTQLNMESFFWVLMYIVGYFTVYGLLWFLFMRHVNKKEDLTIKNRSLVGLIGGCLILNILLNALMVFSGETHNVVNSIVYHVSSVFNCLLLLQWQFKLVQTKRLETELDFTKKLLVQSKEQYKISKENIDLINMKCHDMKHQIREIGSRKQLEDETIKDLEQSISVYDSVVKTDNEALDVILTEKSFKCLRHNIVLKCIADGQILNFMKDGDVYSLFGNALDNAIEAVIRLQDETKRVISLKIHSVGDLVTINIKNFYQGEIRMNADGYPCTTKSNKDYHGYGIKSIRMVTEKYDGSLSIRTKGDIFNLNILIPIPKSANA